MNNRDLFNAIMHYEAYDRMPVFHWTGWGETVARWLDSGVNVMFPVEIGAWNADPMALRQKYGRELRIFGGIDKLTLERGPAAIDAEISRRLPLMKEGGYVPLPDHLITPDTSLENVRYYLDKIRELRF